VSLQAVTEGQDTWAAVLEMIRGLESEGWTVDRYFPTYPAGVVPTAVMRLREIRRVQTRIARSMAEYDAIYLRAHPLAWPTARRAARRGIPLVQECNGPYEDLFMAWPKTRPGRPVFEWMQRWQYKRASAIITVAQGLTEWLADETGHNRIATIGNGANTDVFTPDAPRRPGLPPIFAVFFGQFPIWQGIDSLLTAVRLPEWPEDVVLVFMGDGAMRPAIDEAISEMPERVMNLGQLPYEEVATVVAHALVSYVPMAAPERERRFSPLKLYESMACGVPVIASDVVGISEVVREVECGILFPAGDAHRIAQATAELYADPERAREMGIRGRDAAVSSYSWLARARQRLAVVEEAITRGV
jgi:glycosyltransferase involved in cell wall biosynthesis